MITALIPTTLQPTQIQPFPAQLEQINNPVSDPDSPFALFFGAALDMVRDTNQMQLNAQQAQIDFATGRLDDIIAVQLAMDRAGNALNFTTQVTNRIIESYREIMRMQV